MEKTNTNDNSEERPAPALAHVVRRYEQELKFQRALYQIANLANDSEDLESFYQQVHRIVAQLTAAKNFFIAILNEKEERVCFPYFIDGELTTHPYESMDLETVNRLTFASLILESKQTVHLSYEEMSALKHQIDPDVGAIAQDWLGVPLIHSGRLLGALVIQSYETGFRYGKTDEQLMTNIGHCVATALMKKNVEEELMIANEKLKSKNVQLEETTRNLFDSNEELVKSLQVNRETQEKLRFNATHDALTQLPNRAHLLSELRERINAAQLGSNSDFAILFLDLDRFKVVNDSLGHLAGDKLLVEVANRLRTCVRPSDTVARLGGDEFCILLAQSVTREAIEIVANRILTSLTTPFKLHGQNVVTSTSIGVTVGKLGYENAEDMLRDADTALYQVKANGKADYKMFDVSMRETAIRRLEMEQALRQTVERNDVSVLFQPICDLKSHRIVSFEALARWDHTEIGIVSPNVFIPIAEEIHIIQQLTECVLEKSGDAIRELRESIPGQQSLCLNVNFSSYDIQNGACVEKVKKLLDRCQLPARNLKIEITESLFLDDFDGTVEILTELRQLGVQLVLDDFGTGYSSLSYLNRLPINELKIDRSFVANIETEPRSQAIVNMVVAMAKVLELKVVAEGIESQGQVDLLNKAGVEFGQGYLIGKPIDSAEVRKLLQSANSSGQIFVPGAGLISPVNSTMVDGAGA